MLLVNCTIHNAKFDSPLKARLTLRERHFKMKCTLSSKKFVREIVEKIDESIPSVVKEQNNIVVAEDGDPNSPAKELILVFGKVAKMLTANDTPAKYRVLKLKNPLPSVKAGKMHRNNADVNDLMDAIGLQYGETYSTIDDLAKLHCRKVIILNDQNEIGYNVKKSIMIFFNSNWCTLLSLPFLEEFILPIAKICHRTKKNDKASFYSPAEFDEWQQKTSSAQRRNDYVIKCSKELGNAEGLLNDSRRILHRYNKSEDFEMALSKGAPKSGSNRKVIEFSEISIVVNRNSSQLKGKTIEDDGAGAGASKKQKKTKN